MYTDMDCRKTVDYYRSQGLQFRNITSLKMGEYSRKAHKSFTFESFTAVISGLSDTDKKKVLSIADAFGYYLIPIVELDAEHPNNKSGERDSVMAWIPMDFLKTLVFYLEDFERLVKESYDYLQEEKSAVRLTTDLEMVRGYVEHFEHCRTEIRTAMIGSLPDECPNLLLSHFRGASKGAYISLVDLVQKLNKQWDSNSSHWKLWQDALDGEWHVDQCINSPLKNFEKMVSEMQRKEDTAKQVRTALPF